MTKTVMTTRIHFRRACGGVPTSQLRRRPLPPLVVALLCLSSSVGLPTLLRAKDKPEKSTTYTIPVPAKPDFSEFDWLVGEWAGKTTGRDPQGEVRFSAAYELDKRFMVLREERSFLATKTTPAAQESWMGILAGRRSDANYVLRVYSSTGFVTRYGVTVDGGVIYLNQQGGEEPPSGWLFRRVFERTNPGDLIETVRAAPPDRPFFDYYTAKLARVPATKPAAPPAKPSKE